MASKHDLLSYGELLEVLGQLVREQRTGTMFIVTESKHSARIGLERGRVISCTYTLFRGLDAIVHIRHIRSGKYTFSDGVFNSAAEIPLPSTQDLLQDLAMTVESDSVSRTPSLETGEGSIPAVAAAGLPAEMAISGKALWHVVVSEMAVHLGPAASFAAADYEEALCSATSRGRVLDILSKLALEIAESARAQEFKERVMARISA